MNRKEKILSLKCYFPDHIGQSLEMISDYENIHEIRLRTNRPLGIVSFGKEKFLTKNGSLTNYTDMCRLVGESDIEYSFRAICDYSVHSFKREISEGFVTLEGGNRVGICGTAVTENGEISTLKYISGINFRIAGQAFGCAEDLCRKIFSGGIASVIIIGAPMSGKTTIIRDMCRIIGRNHHLSVIDERGEIGAVYHGISQNSVGELTDIFDGYPKASGIMTAVRVMSPEIVVCDEIGGKDDCEALLSSANMGVKIIASAHGSKIEEVAGRRYLDEVMANGIFDYAVLLDSGLNIGKVKKIERMAKKGD